MKQDVQKSQEFLNETYNLIKTRKDNQCNFIEGSKLLGGANTKIIYRVNGNYFYIYIQLINYKSIILDK